MNFNKFPRISTNFKKKAKAFTLMELLIVVAITTILAGVGISSYVNQQRTKLLDTTAQEIVGYLRYAQQKSIAQESGNQWGIHFENSASSDDFYALYTGASYTSSEEIRYLPKELEFQLPLSGNTVDISFSKLTGINYSETDQYIILKSAYNNTATIFISSQGLITLMSWSKCGDSIAFIYKGNLVIYETVLNPDTGQCWMDRNLGASQVATVYNDSNAYGDLFQWGRLDDGHQARTSGTTYTLSSTDVPGHSNFIFATDDPNDWRLPQNDNLWQGDGGINDPCPSSWRIPTQAEWEEERLSWSSNDHLGAYDSPLKLTTGGARCFDPYYCTFVNVGSCGDYWSSTVYEDSVNPLLFGQYGADTDCWNSRAYGHSVRCIKN